MSNNITTTQTPNTQVVTMGFGDMQSFEFLQRSAKAFASSTMVPAAYQATVTKGFGARAETVVNPAAVPNCMIALDMAQRMNANPLMVMQNLHIIEGRPSWSSQFIIAAINSSGKFSPLRFDLQWGEEIDATYSTFEWENNRKIEQKHKIRIRNARCVAWAIEKATGERLESAPVTMEMAVNEGWYGKNGSKWRSMPDLMMRYRSASFFGRIEAPELLMGLPSAEELQDVFSPADGGGVVYEGQRPVPQSTGVVNPESGSVSTKNEPTYPQADFDKNLASWAKVIATGRKKFEDLLATVQTKGNLTPEQTQRLKAAVAEMTPQDVTPKPAEQEEQPPVSIDAAQLEADMQSAATLDRLYELADLISELGNPDDSARITAIFDARLAQLGGA